MTIWGNHSATQYPDIYHATVAGKAASELVDESWLADEFIPQRYGSKMHGVGLCDEWPSIKWPCDVTPICGNYTLQPGMMLCVEAYMGLPGAPDGIKLEDQVLITEDGVENLTSYHWDAALMA